MKTAQLMVSLAAVAFLAGLGGCASVWQEQRQETVLGVIISQRILVDGPAGSGVSVGVGAAGGSGGGTMFGLGVNVDLGQVFRGGARRVSRQYSVRLRDGRVFEVQDSGEALADGSCVALVLDGDASPRSIRAAVGCEG